MNPDPEIREQLNRIERCLTGDEAMGQQGLVSRVNNHSTRIKQLELWVFRVAVGTGAVTAGIGLVYKVATDWWPHR